MTYCHSVLDKGQGEKRKEKKKEKRKEKRSRMEKRRARFIAKRSLTALPRTWKGESLCQLWLFLHRRPQPPDRLNEVLSKAAFPTATQIHSGYFPIPCFRYTPTILAAQPGTADSEKKFLYTPTPPTHRPTHHRLRDTTVRDGLLLNPGVGFRKQPETKE